MHLNSSLAAKDCEFPDANRRKPELVLRVRKNFCNSAGKPAGLRETPDPYVGVEEVFHSRQASQSSKLPVGPMMSPRISAVPAPEPKRLPLVFSGDVGINSATGSPNLVRRMGLRVLRTSSIRPRHLALNSDTAISFMRKLYHGQ